MCPWYGCGRHEAKSAHYLILEPMTKAEKKQGGSGGSGVSCGSGSAFNRLVYYKTRLLC